MNPLLFSMAIALTSSAFTAQDEKADVEAGATTLSVFPRGYLDHAELNKAIRALASDHPDAIKIRSIARTAQDREILLATLGAPEGTAPAILIVGNLEADHLVGAEVALKMIKAIAEGEPQKITYYIVPRLNADGAEQVLKGTPRSSFRLNLGAVDRDRDGKFGEDGPDDLDGDTLATKMRIKEPGASMIADDKDPRILRKADAAKGERGEITEVVESLDNDGDGVIGEDPAGGVNLNRNWPHNWTEFDLETGWTPASEPEVRGLIEFAFAHPEIAAVWTFALNENLKKEPKKPESTLDGGDLPLFAELVREFGKVVKVPAPRADAKVSGDEHPKAVAAVPEAQPLSATRPKPKIATTPEPVSLEGTTDGAMSEWAYHQFGVIGLSSRLWASPEIPEPEKGKPAVPADGEARWLYWNDNVMGGRAFVPFHAFEHPELGPVEIGGWIPGIRVNPPIERVEPIATAHMAFLKDLAGRLPRLELKDVKATSKGAGVYEITATIRNDGYLPTALAQGLKTRTAPPILVRLEGEGLKMLSGKAKERVSKLAGSGGQVEYRWLILAPEDLKTLKIKASCAKAGAVETTVELKN